MSDGEIFVHPDFQSKGIGSALIRKLFKTAQTKYKAVAWDAFTPNKFKNPLDWYLNLGFKEVKEWTIISCEIDKVLKKLA